MLSGRHCSRDWEDSSEHNKHLKLYWLPFIPCPSSQWPPNASWNPSQETNWPWIFISGSASGGNQTTTPSTFALSIRLKNHRSAHCVKCVQSLKDTPHAMSWALFQWIQPEMCFLFTPNHHQQFGKKTPVLYNLSNISQSLCLEK